MIKLFNWIGSIAFLLFTIFILSKVIVLHKDVTKELDKAEKEQKEYLQKKKLYGNQ